ncbi:MAG: hypothetical protein ACYSTL_04775, partial [Planctomycetota bacterium]
MPARTVKGYLSKQPERRVDQLPVLDGFANQVSQMHCADLQQEVPQQVHVQRAGELLLVGDEENFRPPAEVSDCPEAVGLMHGEAAKELCDV